MQIEIKDKIIDSLNKISNKKMSEIDIIEDILNKFIAKYVDTRENSEILLLKGEIWKPIKDYEGLYEISNMGRVKSFSISLDGIPGVILIQNKQDSGYLMLSLSKDGISKGVSIHRLVAKTFLPNPLNLPIVNHKNGVKSDNRINNLEWCTQKQNMTHFSSSKSKSKIERIKRNYNQVLNKNTAIKISEAKKGYTLSKEHKEELKQKGKIVRFQRRVINAKTGKIYMSIKEASINENISKDYLCKVLNGRKPNNTNLKFYENS